MRTVCLCKKKIDTLIQKSCSFKIFSILEESCGADLSRWVSHTFLQKRCSFKSFSILEENCAADIINETFKCKTFVGKCSKIVYLPTKAKSFQSFLNSSIILKKFLCLLNQRFWGNQYLKVLMASKCDEEKKIIY